MNNTAAGGPILSGSRQSRPFPRGGLLAKRPRSARDYAELLRAGRWFSHLPPAFQDELLAAAVLRPLKRGERLFSRGDPPTGLFGVVDGAVRVTAVAPNGREALLMLAEPPGWIGEIAVFDGRPRTHDAVADGAALVVHVPQEALLAILAREPRWWRELALLMAGKLRLAFVAMEETALLPGPVRLARRLLLIAEGYGDWEGRTRRVIEVRQEQLALMLSLTRQTTNQLLKELEAQGVIALAYGEIEIRDLEGLRRLAHP